MTNENIEAAPLNLETISVRLARTPEEIEAAQHLRYKVFYEEYKAIPTAEMAAQRRDFDAYDNVTDHLIVVDESIANPRDKIVGTYRMLRREAAEKAGGFYTSGEYNIDVLLSKTDQTLMELGRSCVLDQYRTRPVLQLLWQGITDYMLDHNVGIMFGCASLHGTNIEDLKVPLSYLYHFHLAPEGKCPRALDERYVNMNLMPKDQINEKEAFTSLPPLIKGYLRLGCVIGDGAVIDQQFNTVDVCIVMDMKAVSERHRKFYSRRVNRHIPTAEERTAAQ